jgi:hypothetical protein
VLSSSGRKADFPGPISHLICGNVIMDHYTVAVTPSVVGSLPSKGPGLVALYIIVLSISKQL